MPKVSKQSATEVHDAGVAKVWQDDADGYQISFISIVQDADMAGLLKGLPHDQCPCPHWGFVTKGRLTFTFGDRAETFEAGDGFYVGPGHTPSAIEGTDFVLFSPAELVHEVDKQILLNVQAMAGA
jgi:mannose-6-phosphate isomerase-like protein (cupin superfamily)